MTNVGIRELKDHLSSYVKKVKKGGIITITERGKAVAEIVPMKEKNDEKKLADLVREGKISWGGGEKPGGLENPPKIKGKTVSEIVIEDRR